jgi:mono/diheme cytochrome c family protein
VRLKLNKNWIPVWLKKPTDFRPTTKMPNFRLTDHQIQAISAYIWQSGFTDTLPKHKPGNAAHGKELFETRGCLACHSIGEGDQMQGGTFSANLTRVGEKANYDYLVRWIHNARERTRPYCPYEKKDIGPEDYAKKRSSLTFDLEHSQCPNDGHELQVQNMTVMPSLRLSPEDAEDIATYLMTQKKQEPSSYADAAFMDDPALKAEGKKWVRHYGCAGCHEISGFEDEGRIGTELTYEGSKPIERLDFRIVHRTAQRGGKDAEPIKDQRRSGSGCPTVPRRPVVRPQRILRAQTGRAQRLRPGQGEERDRSSAHAERAPDERSGARSHNVPDGQPGDFPALQLSVQARRLRATIFRKAGGSSRNTTAWDATSSSPDSARS